MKKKIKEMLRRAVLSFFVFAGVLVAAYFLYVLIEKPACCAF